MPIIDLNQCFPVGRDGARTPLPKQQQFLSACLDPAGPKFVRYSGGIGSGKTLIGCITVLHWAVLHPGDYLIARQFMPELKDTTFQTFLEICPPELVAETRAADMVVKIYNVTGGTSRILFRGLEEPDKLRSLNLSGAYIDEAAQVSEAAFMLLQGRLRGKGLRKLIITQNPGGHDWAWRWFVHQDFFTSEAAKASYLNIRAPSRENVHLPDGYLDPMLATWSAERQKRELDGSDDSFEGMIYSEFDRSVHVVKPFAIPKDWVRRIGIDHGYRNAAAWVYGAISPDGDVFIYREYYAKEKLIQEICRENKALWKEGEKFEVAKIDPSTRQTRGTTGKSDWDAYLEHLPRDFPLGLANNDVSQGIDRVKSYLKADKRGKPRLFVFDTCTHLLDEKVQYRWKEQPVGQQGKVNVKEEPVKNNDHALDAERYLIMTCPEPSPKLNDPREKLREHSLERSLYDDLQQLKNPKKPDEFGF